jgi:hypothetical protein
MHFRRKIKHLISNSQRAKTSEDRQTVLSAFKEQTRIDIPSVSIAYKMLKLPTSSRIFSRLASAARKKNCYIHGEAFIWAHNLRKDPREIPFFKLTYTKTVQTVVTLSEVQLTSSGSVVRTNSVTVGVFPSSCESISATEVDALLNRQ